MSVWRGTYTDLMRMRFGALVAYGMALVGDRESARVLAQDASIEVFSGRRTPRSVGQAERAVRDAMVRRAVADGLAPEAAATVLIALDGFAEGAVRKVMGKATPQAMPAPDPDWVATARRTFSTNAAVYAAPAGGMNAVMDPAWQRRRGALFRSGAITAAVAVGVLGIGYGAAAIGLPMLNEEPAAAPPSPSPSSTQLDVTWDDASALSAALGDFEFPECGQTWEPDPVSVGDVTPEPRNMSDVITSSGEEPLLFVTDGFVSEGEGGKWLLANSVYVVTLNDEVVMAATPENAQGLELYLSNDVTRSFGGMGFGRQTLCDAQAAADAYQEEMGEFDWEAATDEERATYDAAWAEWSAQWGPLEPGTYKVYQISPMVFGEQAALAVVLRQEGVAQLELLSSNIQFTALVEDPLLAPFCVIQEVDRDLQAACDIPPDVLAQVLTRTVDPATVIDIPSGVGISEPLEFVVE